MLWPFLSEKTPQTPWIELNGSKVPGMGGSGKSAWDEIQGQGSTPESGESPEVT
jgi:hypothetical protein